MSFSQADQRAVTRLGREGVGVTCYCIPASRVLQVSPNRERKETSDVYEAKGHNPAEIALTLRNVDAMLNASRT